MLKLEVILAENDVMEISEGLKEIDVGGLTIIKVRGRGAKTEPEIHTSKGMEVFTPVSYTHLTLPTKRIV